MEKVSVRAKFLCTSNQKNEDGHMTVNMMAVTNGSEENKTFSEYTPSGNFNMVISKDKPAQKAFIAGREYYIDMTLVEEATAEVTEDDKNTKAGESETGKTGKKK